MITVAVINQKGGCGKTTTAINLAGILARRGRRTLLVDMDPQSHCAAGLAIPEQRIDLDIGDAMLADTSRPFDFDRLLWRVSRDFDLAPSRTRLAGLEASKGGLASLPDKHARLRGMLDRIEDRYDICLIDCSPSIGLLMFNALAAANIVLIPVETSFFSLQGATKQLGTVRTLAQRLGRNVQAWVVPTMHETSSALDRDLLQELDRRFETKVAPVCIRRDIALKEAASFGQPVVEYASESPGARDYAALADWLIEGAGLGVGGRPREPEIASIEPEETYPGGAPRQAEVQVIAREGSESALARRMAASPVTPKPQTPEVPLTPPPTNGKGHRDGSGSDRLAEVAVLAQKLQRERATPKPAPSTPEVEADLNNGFGAHASASGVQFRQPRSLGLEIHVAGDFNNWSSSAHRLRPTADGRALELCLPLVPGRRRYRLVVDGRWTRDPHNPNAEANAFGEENSVVEVPASAIERPAGNGHANRPPPISASEGAD